MKRFNKILSNLVLFGVVVAVTVPLWWGGEEDDYRGPNEFRAARDGESEPSAHTRLEETFRDVMEKLAMGTLGPDDGEAIKEQLMTVLEEKDIGSPALREAEVNVVVETMLHELQDTEPTPLLNDVQRGAIRSQARGESRQLIARVTGGSQEMANLGPIPDGYAEIAWNVIDGYFYEEGMQLPDTVTELDGTKVVMYGYLLGLEQENEYLLVQSLWSCCYGAPPEMNQAIVVEVPDDIVAEVAGEPVRVLGRITVGEEWEDGYVINLYRIDAERVDATVRSRAG